jgi:hypothetical protein
MLITALNPSDIGRWVSYTPTGQPHVTDIGTITSWNPVYVFVRFAHTRRPYWDTGNGPRTPMPCLPDTLKFIQPHPDWEQPF